MWITQNDLVFLEGKPHICRYRLIFALPRQRKNKIHVQKKETPTVATNLRNAMRFLEIYQIIHAATEPVY